MCRMIGYLGETIPLRALVDAPPHSLEKQSYLAREMQGAVVNADGWGVSFYLDDDPDACVYRCTAPIWADVNREHLGRAIRSRCVLAAVRSATDPLGLSHANTQPFSAGALSFVHNGYIRDFDRGPARRLRASLSDEQYARLRGHTDSEHIFAVLLDEYARGEGASHDRLAGAVARALERVRALARESGVAALLTVIASDGRALVGARLAEGAEAPSLYLVAGPARVAPGALLASEPLDDDPAWSAVAPGRLVVVTPDAPPRQTSLP
jgi:ergothioneine biosynthesis protein EgtC